MRLSQSYSHNRKVSGLTLVNLKKKKKQFFGFSYNYFFKLHALTFFLLRILLYCFLGLHSMR